MMIRNTIEQLSEDKIRILVENTTDFAISNGIVLFDKECLPKKVCYKMLLTKLIKRKI